MASDTKHLEVTLETQVESVNLAEEMCRRVAEPAGLCEDECSRTGMSGGEGARDSVTGSGRREMSLHATHRDAGPVTVVDLSGRIVLGDGSALLRKTIRGLLEAQRKLILLNLADVDYIDSSGIGELVSGYTAVKNQNGRLELLHFPHMRPAPPQIQHA